MCECIDKIDENLKKAGHNTAIDVPIIFSTSGVTAPQKTTVATVKADKSNRKKPARLYASYCPFCGIKYETL